jgi:hypothetical protein
MLFIGKANSYGLSGIFPGFRVLAEKRRRFVAISESENGSRKGLQL